MIRLTIPSIDEDDLQAVREALSSGFLIQGKQVAKFEQLVAEYLGTTHAIAVSNCTAALHLSLLALNIKPGDLVIVTSYSWIATANVIELCGAQPIFVDIQPDTFNINPERLGETLDRTMKNSATQERVKAILPVHTFGQMADMTAITELAHHYDIPIIEDAACALGAKWREQQAGTWGMMGCFSFHPRKAITTGEGGIITTNDDDLAHRLRALRNHGQDPRASSPDFVLPGFNYRMTEFQAALGQTQLKKLDQVIAKRRERASYYDDLLKDSEICPPIVQPENWAVFQSYIVLLPDSSADYRKEIIAKLKNKGVEITIGTIHMPMASYFRKTYSHNWGDFPVTDIISKRSLSLPLYDTISKSAQEAVVTNLLNAIR